MYDYNPLTLSSHIFYLFLKVCVYPQRTEKGAGFPQAAVTGGCETFSTDAGGLQLGSSGLFLQPQFNLRFLLSVSLLERRDIRQQICSPSAQCDSPMLHIRHDV